jgi:hypothetical protein
VKYQRRYRGVKQYSHYSTTQLNPSHWKRHKNGYHKVPHQPTTTTTTITITITIIPITTGHKNLGYRLLHSHLQHCHL